MTQSSSAGTPTAAWCIPDVNLGTTGLLHDVVDADGDPWLTPSQMRLSTDAIQRQATVAPTVRLGSRLVKAGGMLFNSRMNRVRSDRRSRLHAPRDPSSGCNATTGHRRVLVEAPGFDRAITLWRVMTLQERDRILAMRPESSCTTGSRTKKGREISLQMPAPTGRTETDHG